MIHKPLPPKKGVVQKAKHTAPSSDKKLHEYASYLERQTIRARPEHKHERYSRIQNQAAYEANYELAFGKRDPDHFQKRAAKTRTTYKDSEFKKP